LTVFVVDASVGLKWCLPQDEEDFIPQAKELLHSFLAKDLDFLVPDLFWVEIGNALWKLIRRKKLSPDAASASLTTLRDLEISTVPSYRLVVHALDLAVQYDRTVYDSVYVALARESSIELVTADERLANALAAYLPVKWLGAI
jgi:predicted nucleic acid-binding protein